MLVVLVVYFTLTGGQISILVTDFWQAILSLFAFIVIIVFLFYEFSWETIEAGLIAVSEPGRSKINPFDIGREENFNFVFYFIFWFTLVYKYEAWHGNQGYEAAAISPHEQKMAQVSGYMRGFMIEVCLIIIPLCALALMNLPEYANQAAQVNQVLDSQFLSDSRVDLQGKRRIGALWVSIGGFSDLIRLYRGLREKERDDADDGFVKGQTSISELSEEEKYKIME